MRVLASSEEKGGREGEGSCWETEMAGLEAINMIIPLAALRCGDDDWREGEKERGLCSRVARWTMPWQFMAIKIS